MSAKFKQGFVREDGMRFWGYRDGKEVWISEESYQMRRESRRQYRRRVRQMGLEHLKRKDPMDQPYLGKYDFSRNLYFLELGSNGKEVWGTKQQLEHFKERRRIGNDRYIDRCALLPDLNLRHNDPHPDNPNLFVLRKVRNKCFFGTAEELAKVLEQRRITSRKGNQLRKYKRRMTILKLGAERLNRGVERNGMFFWNYTAAGREKWVTPEQFAFLKEQSRQISKRTRQKKKARKQASPSQKGKG